MLQLYFLLVYRLNAFINFARGASNELKSAKNGKFENLASILLE